MVEPLTEQQLSEPSWLRLVRVAEPAVSRAGGGLGRAEGAVGRPHSDTGADQHQGK
jgi:hypothetical protein